MPLPEPLNSADLQPFLDNPERLASESRELQLAIANYPATPRHLLEVLIGSGDPQVAQAARLHVNWAGEITEGWQEVLDAELQNVQLGQNDRLAVELLKIGPVPDYFFSEWVPAERFIEGLRNPYLPLRYRLKLLERLAKEPTLEPRLQVAESTETPLAVLEQLAGDLEMPIRLAVKYNSNCPPGLIELIEGQHTIATDWNTDAEQLAMLGQSRWVWIRLAVAQNPSTPPETLMQLARDSVFKIQLAVAQNPQTPANVLAILAQNSEKRIQEAVAEHPNVTEEILHQLFPTQQHIFWKRQSLPTSILERLFREAATKGPIWKEDNLPDFLAGQPNTPTWILAELANVELEEFRRDKIAYFDSLPLEIVENNIENALQFLADIAKHPQVTVEILERLSEYSIPDVQLAVAQNLKTPQASYHDFLIQQRTTPGHILEQIVNRVSDYQRAEIARHPQVLITTLEQLAGDSKPKVRLTVALNDKTSNELRIKLFEQLATECFESIRAAVAGDSRTPVSLLEQMCINVLPHAQSERLVCAALIANSNTPTALKIQLSEQVSPVNPDGYKDLELRLALRLNRDIFVNQQVNYLQNSANSVDRNSIQELAKNPNTPVHILELLAALGEASQGLSKNPYTPAHILRKLAQEASPEIHRAIANNPATPVDVLVQLASLPGEKTINHVPKIRECVLNNPSLPVLERYRLLLEKEQEQENAKAREFMSRRPNSPFALAEVLKSGDRTALYNAARNSLTPVHILEQLAKHPDENVRSVLLDNRNLPLKIRLELTRDPSVSVRRGLAYKSSHRETPVQVLEILANDESEKVRATVAENSDTPVEILVKLANDTSREVKNKLVANLNTPVAVLERLGLEEGILNIRNPKTPGNVLAQAASRMSGDRLVDLLRYSVQGSQMPASTLEELANHNNNSVRYEVASHPNTPVSALEKLSRDSYIYTVSRVASNRNTPPHVLEQLATHPDYTIRHDVAGNPNTPPAALELLARYIESEANAPSTTNDANKSTRRGGDNNEILKMLAGKPRTPIAVLEMLAAREFAGGEEIGREPNDFSGPRTPEEVLESLVYNPSLTPQILARLAFDPSPKIRSLLIHNPNATPELWEQLARDENVEVRCAIASSSKCPISILQTLASDREEDVRHKVANNPNTPANTLEFLCQDVDAKVREAIASNPNTTPSVLEQLAPDEKVEVRRAVAKNPHTLATIRESLRDLVIEPFTRQTSPTLRGLSRIYNPNTDDLPTLLSEYVQSPNAFVRFVALMHPLTPVDAIGQGSQSVFWCDRYAVADNPSTPVEMRQQLARDCNRIVRATAKSYLENF